MKIKNLDNKLIINVLNEDNSEYPSLGNLAIDLSSEPFGKVIEKDYSLSYGSITMKWQVTEPCVSRWNEKIFIPNVLNINLGKYNSMRNSYEYWIIKLGDIYKQTMITPCGAFNEIFSFILTDQNDIIFEQYILDSNNYPKLNKTIPFNFSNIQNGPFTLIDDLSGFIEVVPYGTKPFQGQIFPLYFYPNPKISISLIVYDVCNSSYNYNNSSDLYLLFKYKDRKTLIAKSRRIREVDRLNQYFNLKFNHYQMF